MNTSQMEQRRLARQKAKPRLLPGLTLWLDSDSAFDSDEFDISSEPSSDPSSSKVRPKKGSKRSKSAKKTRRKRPRPRSPSSDSSGGQSGGRSKPNSDRPPTALPPNQQRPQEGDGLPPRFIGPVLPSSLRAAAGGPATDYGENLYRGEGEAIASFVQKGVRIPRRGEVGLSSKEISDLESLGYVMSGSRNTRMNAMRIRKENQVYSAEEKKALALISTEEKSQKEKRLIGDMRRFLKARVDRARRGGDCAQ